MWYLLFDVIFVLSHSKQRKRFYSGFLQEYLCQYFDIYMYSSYSITIKALDATSAIPV